MRFARLILAALAALPLGREAAAQSFGDTARPLLRIETAMHGGAINRLALAGDSLVTVSDDKTMRRWSLGDGQASGLWRVPVGGGDTGALYALAVGGQTAVAGGRTGDNNFSLFVFDLGSGRQLGTVGPFPDPITALAFDAGGTRLAVGFQHLGGLKVIDLKTHSIVASDKAYRGTVNWLAFAADGRLASSAEDGMIRLYAGDFDQPAATQAMGAGDVPWAVAFSKDGQSLAVGSAVQPHVRLFHTDKLQPEWVLSGAPGAQGALSVVGWSADGRLVAAGEYKNGPTHNLLRFWPLGGSEGRDVEVAPDTVTDLAFIGDGSLVYVTAQSSFGRISADGLPIWVRDSEQCDFRDIWQNAFFVSKDGSIVEFPCRQGGQDRFRVDLTEISLRINQPPRDDLKPPTTAAVGLVLDGWRNGAQPKINGRALSLDPHEHAHSVAVLPAQAAAVFATDYYLRLEKPAAEGWRRVLPAPAWAVDVTPNGRYVVAALGDGTIRWYAAADGTEIIDLFVDARDRRWAVWVPEGFFDASQNPDGGSLIGFQLNNGPAKPPDFEPAARLEAAFHRRELVLAKYWGGPHEVQRVTDELAKLGNGRATLDASAGQPSQR